MSGRYEKLTPPEKHLHLAHGLSEDESREVLWKHANESGITVRNFGPQPAAIPLIFCDGTNKLEAVESQPRNKLLPRGASPDSRRRPDRRLYHRPADRHTPLFGEDQILNHKHDKDKTRNT